MLKSKSEKAIDRAIISATGDKMSTGSGEHNRLLLDCVLISFNRPFIVSWSTWLCFSIFVCSSVMSHFSKLMTIALAMFWHSFVLIDTIVAKCHCRSHRHYCYPQLTAYHTVHKHASVHSTIILIKINRFTFVHAYSTIQRTCMTLHTAQWLVILLYQCFLLFTYYTLHGMLK